MFETNLGAVLVAVGVAVIGVPNENTGGADVDEVDVGFVETPDNEAKPKLLGDVGSVMDEVDAAGNPNNPALGF